MWGKGSHGQWRRIQDARDAARHKREVTVGALSVSSNSGDRMADNWHKCGAAKFPIIQREWRGGALRIEMAVGPEKWSRLAKSWKWAQIVIELAAIRWNMLSYQIVFLTFWLALVPCVFETASAGECLTTPQFSNTTTRLKL